MDILKGEVQDRKAFETNPLHCLLKIHALKSFYPINGNHSQNHKSRLHIWSTRKKKGKENERLTTRNVFFMRKMRNITKWFKVANANQMQKLRYILQLLRGSIFFLNKKAAYKITNFLPLIILKTGQTRRDHMYKLVRYHEACYKTTMKEAASKLMTYESQKKLQSKFFS